MLEIIKEEIVDGYRIIEYSNGAVVKQSVNAVNGGVEEVEIPLSPMEQAIMQTAINTEYMTAMMEATI